MFYFNVFNFRHKHIINNQYYLSKSQGLPNVISIYPTIRRIDRVGRANSGDAKCGRYGIATDKIIAHPDQVNTINSCFVCFGFALDSSITVQKH